MNKIQCPSCEKSFRPAFRWKYSCICPYCEEKIEFYKNFKVKKFLSIASVLLFLVLTAIVKVLADGLKIMEIVVLFLMLPVFYIIINPIYNYIIIRLYNSSAKNDK